MTTRTSLSARIAVPVLGTAIAGVFGTGTAVAFWSSHGTGAGSASTGTVSLQATVTAGTGLYPGASVPVSVTVKNTSASASLKVTALAVSPPITSSGGIGSCTTGSITFTPGTIPTTALAPTQTEPVPGTVSMSLTADNGCQGATFTIPLTATGQTS